MALSPDEKTIIERLSNKLRMSRWSDDLMDGYYEGQQRLSTLGLAVPPALQKFTTVVNWPAVVVDSVAERIKLKGFILPGQDEADDGLQAGWEANNLDSDQHMLWNDKLVYGRGFAAVGANDEDREFPLITVESPREMAVDIDPRVRRVRAALRVYQSDVATTLPSLAPLVDPSMPELLTLYLPDQTIWCEAVSGGWNDYERDVHKLGRVPVVPFLNRRRTGKWTGVSEMKRAISLTDAAARALTNLQLAQETHAVPQRYALGFSKGDFVDGDGNPLPVWQAYFSGIWASANADGKVGQFSASDLRNFTETVNFYGRLVSGIYGLPPQYTGQASDNPSSAEAIREAKEGLIMRAELHESYDGDALGKLMALYMRFRDGVWPDGSRIRALWFDPATPTFAARADAVSKLSGGVPILSREGAWDELDWSEPRKAKERQYFADQESDPFVAKLAGDLVGGGLSDAQSEAADIKAKADAMGVLIRAGVDTADAARRVGMAGVKFTGAIPVSLRVPESQAAHLEGSHSGPA